MAAVHDRYYNNNTLNDDSDSEDYDDDDDYSLLDDASLFTTEDTLMGMSLTNRNSMYTTTTAIVRAATAPKQQRNHYHGKRLVVEQQRRQEVVMFQNAFANGGVDNTAQQRRLQVNGQDNDEGADQPVPPPRCRNKATAVPPPPAVAPSPLPPQKKNHRGVWYVLDEDIRSSIRHFKLPEKTKNNNATSTTTSHPPLQRPGPDDASTLNGLSLLPTATLRNSTITTATTTTSSSRTGLYHFNPEASYTLANANAGISEWSFRGSAVLREANRQSLRRLRQRSAANCAGAGSGQAGGGGGGMHRMDSMDDIGIRYGLGKDYSLFDLHEDAYFHAHDSDNDEHEDGASQMMNGVTDNDDGLLPVAPRELHKWTKIQRRGARLQRAIQGVGLIVTGQFLRKKNNNKQTNGNKKHNNSSKNKKKTKASSQQVQRVMCPV